jgi:Ca2+-binding EF-hand superfamily protein
MVTLLNLFSALDSDADGTLSTADLISAEQSRFFAADTSGDGYVDASELSAYWAMEPTAAHSPDRAGVFILSEDQTGDGRLDMIEFINPERQNTLLLQMESDGHPGVSLSELRIFLQR